MRTLALYRLFALIGACLVFLPTVSSAQNALGTSTSSKSSPVTINLCQPIFHNNQFATPSASNPNSWLASQSNGMQIQFTNESNKVADLINFEVRSNGVQFVIRDVGKFSPGVTIDHNFRNSAGQAFVLPAFIPPNVKCHVASVRFTDGTVWPVKHASSSLALSANPTSVSMSLDTDSSLVMVSTTGTVGGFTETNNCDGIAAIAVATTAQRAAVYNIRPLGKGACTLHVSDEGRTVDVPINVQ